MGKHRRSRLSWAKRQRVIVSHRKTSTLKRRTVLMSAALGAVGVLVGASTLTAPGIAQATETTAEPAFGAGLFDVDPDQGSISQDPNVVVAGDISLFPEDWEF
jgi:hypothetical protein